MSADERPRFKWIVTVAADVSDCSVRYCVKQASYWAMWDPDIRRPVCSLHRDAVENKAWQEAMGMFRPIRMPK